MTTRGLLEELAARHAAGNFTSSEVATLARVARKMEVAARKGRTKEVVALDRQFHFTIYNAARRPHLLGLIEQLWNEFARCVAPSDTTPDFSPDGLRVLHSIVSACEIGDANGLGLMVRYKIHQSVAHLERDEQPAIASPGRQSDLKVAE